MMAQETKEFSPAYSAWFGKQVVLLVVIRQRQVFMPCRIVGETVAHVHVRIKAGWEMDVRKQLILAVQEEAIAQDVQINRPDPSEGRAQGAAPAV
jgi:hypothetical protein